MAHITEDRILESTTSTGTGDILLAGAITAFRRFNTVCAVGDTLPYFIEAIDALGMPTGDYEYGIATYSAANTLTRTKVQGSSNGGAPVNFQAGSKNVGIPALASSLVPTGARIEFLGNPAPTGYLELDGSLKSRLQYPALYAYALASGVMAVSDAAWTKGMFSPGDGATTFRLPDHRGYVAKGWDHGAGVDSGRTLGSVQADQFPQHNHGFSGGTSASGDHQHQHVGPSFPGGTPWGSAGGAGLYGGGTPDDPGTIFYTSPAGNHAHSFSGTTNVAGTGTEVRVKNISVLVCVKT